jgi:MFS family permease
MIFFSVTNKDVQMEVQTLVNNFQMISQWISSVPSIAFSIMAGALSDIFGRKPLMLFPLIGFLLGSFINIINYAFINILPLEFFYLYSISAFFGGSEAFYLGVFSYATNVTNDAERTHGMTRMDGMITLATVAGTLLSPHVFKHLGYYGNYISSALYFVLAMVYLIFFVQEPIKKLNTENEEPPETRLSETELYQVITKFFTISCVLPIIEIKKFLSKNRQSMLMVIILLQLFCFCIYAFSRHAYRLTYLYMLLIFDGFTATDYAYMTVAMDILKAIIMLFAMPVISGKYQIHDSLVLSVFVACEVVGAVLKPFMSTLWQFYLASGIGIVGSCKFAMVRCLMSKTIGTDEVGKMFSLIAVLSALLPFAGIPAFRQLYNQTISTFPPAIFLFFASLQALAVLCNLFIYLTWNKIKNEEDN